MTEVFFVPGKNSRYLVDIASLNKQPLTHLQYAHLCLPKDITVVCSRREFARDQGVGDKSITRIISIKKVSTIIPITLYTMHIYVYQWIEVCFTPDKNLFRRRVLDISRARIVYKSQVTTTIQESSVPLYLPTYRSVVCARQKFA